MQDKWPKGLWGDPYNDLEGVLDYMLDLNPEKDADIRRQYWDHWTEFLARHEISSAGQMSTLVLRAEAFGLRGPTFRRALKRCLKTDIEEGFAFVNVFISFLTDPDTLVTDNTRMGKDLLSLFSFSWRDNDGFHEACEKLAAPKGYHYELLWATRKVCALYRNGKVKPGTYGSYLRTVEQVRKDSRIAVSVSAASRAARGAVTALTMAGTDYSLPIYNFGINQIMKCFHDPNWSRFVESAIDFRPDGVRSRQPLRESLCLLTEYMENNTNVTFDKKDPRTNRLLAVSWRTLLFVLNGWAVNGGFAEALNNPEFDHEAHGFFVKPDSDNKRIVFNLPDELVKERRLFFRISRKRRNPDGDGATLAPHCLGLRDFGRGAYAIEKLSVSVWSDNSKIDSGYFYATVNNKNVLPPGVYLSDNDGYEPPEDLQTSIPHAYPFTERLTGTPEDPRRAAHGTLCAPLDFQTFDKLEKVKLVINALRFVNSAEQRSLRLAIDQFGELLRQGRLTSTCHHCTANFRPAAYEATATTKDSGTMVILETFHPIAQSYLSAAPVPMNVLVNNYAVRDLSGEGESLTRLVVSTLANDGKGAEPALSALNFMQMEEMADPKFKSDFADFFRDAKRMYRTYPYTFKDQNNNKYKMAFTKKSLECLLPFFSLLDLHSQRFFSFKDSDTTMELTVVLPGEYENTTFLADVQVRSFFSSDTAQNIENCIFECVRTRESGLSTTVVDTQLTVFDNIAIWRSEAGRYLQNYTPKLLLSMFTYRFTRPEESFLPSL
ncbi:UNVERIFIED_CONTAM: hypothetical protein FKN15_057232 [Acipenser sinensis]